MIMILKKEIEQNMNIIMIKMQLGQKMDAILIVQIEMEQKMDKIIIQKMEHLNTINIE